ncbi:MAG: sugar ABC transporter substrate-binding protein [Candidatus Heimdallarchaeaceae archaeon]
MVSKYLKITLVAVLILSLIVPAIFFSFYNQRNNEIVIELWYTYEGGDIIEEAIAEYEVLNPSISIIFVEQPSSSWIDKFINVAQTGNAPDIFLAKGSWFGELANLGYIQSLTNFLTPADETEYLTSGINGLSYENELWGLPLWFDSILLFYNKDLFDNNAQSYPQENWTSVEFLDAALNLTNRPEDDYGLAWATISPYMWPAFQYGFDHGPLYQGGDIVVNDTASYNSLEYIYDLKYTHRCVKYDDSSSSATQAFATEKAAMLIYGGWYIPALNELDVNYGMEILPTISSTGQRITPMVEVKGWGMSKDTENPDICYDIMKYLASATIQENLLIDEYKVPTLKELESSSLVQDNPLILKQIKQIEYSQYYPLDPYYIIYSEFMRAALNFILLYHHDIQTTLDETQQNIEANKDG